MKATPNSHNLPIKSQGFANLAELLDYAARGDTGFNFYDDKGRLATVLPYRQLRDEARTLARRLLSLGCPRNTPVGIVGETDPNFQRFFFACQYAGLIPVALPGWVHFGGHDAYVDQVRRLLRSSGAQIAVAPDSHADFLPEICAGLDITMAGPAQAFDALPETDQPLRPPAPGDIAYLQYTSGSTRFPRGVEVTQRSVLHNLSEIARFGLKLVPGDRFVSWLPYYHDMGLVGFILAPMICQLSADFLSTRTFAMRPRLWLRLLSDNGGTITSSTSLGYALCARRLSKSSADQYDLRSLRVAAVGAERINPAPLRAFAEALEPAGFDPNAFLACYGMAECVLAVSFAPLGQGLEIDSVDRELMTSNGVARPILPGSDQASDFVNCGALLPSYRCMIRDADGSELGERECGQIFLQGPSVMTGYFKDDGSTREVLSDDGWLDTGDIGYRTGSTLVVTARSKDVIIVNGRNIWPCDLESLLDGLPGVRLGGVSAFSHLTDQGIEEAVVVVETKYSGGARGTQLIRQINRIIHENFGIDVHVDLVPNKTLPRTSSGKLSRSQAKQDFLDRESARAEAPAIPLVTSLNPV